jgi:hypothetical protein
MEQILRRRPACRARKLPTSSRRPFQLRACPSAASTYRPGRVGTSPAPGAALPVQEASAPVPEVGILAPAVYGFDRAAYRPGRVVSRHDREVCRHPGREAYRRVPVASALGREAYRRVPVASALGREAYRRVPGASAPDPGVYRRDPVAFALAPAVCRRDPVACHLRWAAYRSGRAEPESIRPETDGEREQAAAPAGRASRLQVARQARSVAAAVPLAAMSDPDQHRVPRGDARQPAAVVAAANRYRRSSDRVYQCCQVPRLPASVE